MPVPGKLAQALSAKVGIEIGDTKQPEFYPQLKTMLWDNECNFSLRFTDHAPQEQAVVEMREDGASWTKSAIKVDFRQSDDGYSFDVILLQAPASNVLNFTTKLKDLVFARQPDADSDSEGAFNRPDNVKGSYAVYHPTRMHGKYQTGKAFHLYRPLATDANSVQVWCDIDIDVATERLIITIPQDFLAAAVYPVVVQ